MLGSQFADANADIMEDDINNKVYALVERILGKLIECGEVIDKLSTSSKNLVPAVDAAGFVREFEEWRKELHSAEKSSKEYDEQELISKMINRLESQRIDLVVSIQQEDFLKDKLLELINHNSEMILSVKEYLENKSTLIKEDYNIINERLKVYLNRIKLNLVNLQFNNYEMNKNMKRIEQLIQNIEVKEVKDLDILIKWINENGKSK